MGQRTAALVLAAGSSRRMNAGRPKHLLPLGGRPVLRWCCEALLAGGIEEIVVVRAPGMRIEDALGGLRVATVVNPKAGSEMADSLRCGLGAVDGGATGILVCLADHPLVAAATIRALERAHRSRPTVILVPVFQGRKGHPALFPAAVAKKVTPGRTLRDVRLAHAALVEELPVEDPGVIFDMDTPDDYREALARVGRQGGDAMEAKVLHGCA